MTKSDTVCKWAYSKTLKLHNERRFLRALRDCRRYENAVHWSLSDNAFRAVAHLLENKEQVRIVEFGSGASTIFFDRYFSPNLTLTSFDHLYEFALKTSTLITSSRANIHVCELRQFSDEEFEIILTGVTLAQLRSMGSLVPKSQYLDTRIKNAFYDIQDSQLGRDYDLMILDGPSGNGRSVAFGVMKERMKRPGFILIDDFNHYQFLYDCSRCFRFNVMLGEILPSKRWVLLEVK